MNNRVKRSNWLASMINREEYWIGAEVGVLKGNTTAYLLRNCPTLDVLYAVDMWAVVPPHLQTEYWREVHGKISSNRFKAIRNEFNKNVRPFKDRVIPLCGLSWEMAGGIADGILDFVFIDADHAYTSVRKDILAWAPKLRVGGMLSGHDINLPGVAQATRELCKTVHVPRIDNCWWCKREDVIRE
jgi:hypothetical protein